MDDRLRETGGSALITGVVICVAATVLAGCATTTSIPPGAQQVHIEVTSSEVRLDPSTVRAGDTYLVLDAPLDGSITFVERQRAGETPGPLTEGDLARLAQGDTGGTMIGGLDAGGCDAAQDAAARGQLGYCGNVMKVVLAPGKYLIAGDVPEADPAGNLPPMAVLEVLP